MVITIIGAVAFFGLGILFLMGKGANLIAGYNTMPEKEKAQVNEKALLKFMGYMMFVFSFCIILWAVGMHLNLMWIFYTGLAIFLTATIFILIYVNISPRFKN